MPISPLFNYAAEPIHRWQAGMNAGEALRDFMHRHPRFPQAGRTKLTRAVYAYFRWHAWLTEKTPLPAQIGEAVGWQDRFERDPHSVKDQALAARAVPEWVWDEIDFGPAPADATRKIAWLRSLQQTPPLWLRARPGRSAALARQLGTCAPPPDPALTPDALHFKGAFDLFQRPEFLRGDFEIQDLASQMVGAVCAPQVGATWWDACAGEGGKSLHLADLMQNKGTVWCSDRSTRRAETLRRRFNRAKLFNYRFAAWDGGAKPPTKGKFDGILVDAPCSGLGTWARNPDARWTTTPEDVAELAAVQLRLLAHVAGALKPGGRLVYAVCTLTRRETTAVTDAFTAAHPELEPIPLLPAAGCPLPEPNGPKMEADAATALRPPISGLATSASTLLWPHELGANGMFIAAWRRR